MSLLILMYHRAQAGRHGNTPAMLEAHFAQIAKTYANVLPGDPLAPGRLNVCLSFDDGYYDFYATVFPLLQKHRLRALLAIPPGIVRDQVETSAAARLSIDSAQAFAQPERGGFCTWSELKEMITAGCVTVAAHGFNHVRLDAPEVPLTTEVELPRSVLEGRLDRPVETFVFPFGRYSQRSLRHVKRYYRYALRIGGALNAGWGSELLYRVDADRMENARSLFSPGHLARYRARFIWNRLRNR